MVRYNRVSMRTESEDHGDSQDTIAVESSHSPANDQKLHPSINPLARIESNDRSLSSKSYKSRGSDAQDYLNSSGSHRFGDSGDSDDIDEEERSPLTQNAEYASNDGLLENMPMPGDDRSVTPLSLFPSMAAISFDLDDDDDDEVEANLQRYHLDFTSTENGDYLARVDIDEGDGSDQGAASGSSNWCSSGAKYVWFSVQSARQKARQRRAQMLLDQTERNWKQSLKICVLTSCDNTDLGIFLFAIIALVWIVVLLFIRNPVARRKGILAGIILVAVRMGARPFFHWLHKHWQRRSSLRQRVCGSAQDSSLDGMASGQRGLELHSIRDDEKRDYNHADGLMSPVSAGSDPTVAAI